MEVIGNGFIAGHARAHFAERHPSTTLIAAGVSSVLITDVSAFEREATLVYDVIRKCRATGRTVVFLSTASAGMYGASDSPGTEDGAVFPLTPYGRHKLALERVCAISGVRWLVLRMTHIVGAGQQPHQLLPSLTRQLLTGSITVHANASRDLLDVRDMLGILDSLLANDVHNEVVNIASGRPEDIERIVDGLEERLDVHAVRKRVEMPAKQATVDIDKVRSLVPGLETFGFGPDYLPKLLDRHIGELAEKAARALNITSVLGH